MNQQSLDDIENFINYWTSDPKERRQMLQTLEDFIEAEREFIPCLNEVQDEELLNFIFKDPKWREIRWVEFNENIDIRVQITPTGMRFTAYSLINGALELNPSGHRELDPLAVAI